MFKREKERKRGLVVGHFGVIDSRSVNQHGETLKGGSCTLSQGWGMNKISRHSFLSVPNGSTPSTEFLFFINYLFSSM